ncbi:MAG: LptF/LptG family permease [Balneolaceae bacterium]
MNKMDRHIIKRLFSLTFFVLFALIVIYILIDFSENSDDFTDRGATVTQIWFDYYINFIPEMLRLVSPLAIFVACLYLTGQMTERLEIVSIKAAGVSLYRLALPFLFFALVLAGIISYLDAYIIPQSNADRIAFERQYLNKRSDSIDDDVLYRQEAPNMVLNISHFESVSNLGYQATLIEFDGEIISRVITAGRMEWVDSLDTWKLTGFKERIFNETGFKDRSEREVNYDMNIQPQDLARRSSDIYQLTYPEAASYIASIRRIGAGDINLPLVQFYSRLAYPLSIVIVTLIGFALASERRKGGKGFYIAAGLVVSFVYLVFMKVFEPFGAAGTIDPFLAVALPHTFFMLVGIGLLIATKK